MTDYVWLTVLRVGQVPGKKINNNKASVCFPWDDAPVRPHTHILVAPWILEHLIAPTICTCSQSWSGRQSLPFPNPTTRYQGSATSAEGFCVQHLLGVEHDWLTQYWLKCVYVHFFFFFWTSSVHSCFYFSHAHPPAKRKRKKRDRF
jgi:hypothetical protein